MTIYSWLQIAALLVLLAISTPILGTYMAKVYGGGRAPGDRFFLPIERFLYRILRVDPEREQRWNGYVLSMLLFTLVGGFLTYVILRTQSALPGNPDNLANVTPGLTFNTDISFMTNTNWQSYAGESTMSQLSQMFGLVWHQFISAAVGMALAAAFIRALVRRGKTTLGNFWVDTIRSTLRILLPIAFVFAIVFMSQGTIQNFQASTNATTVAAQATNQTSDTALQQQIPGGPVASMLPIEALGDNGGGYFNANGAHPFENPNPVTNLLIIWLFCMIAFAFPWTFGLMVGSKKEGLVVLIAMAALFVASICIATPLEANGNPNVTAAGVTQAATSTNSGGNLEGKDLRNGVTGSVLDGVSATSTSTGLTNSAHESYTPLGGAVPLVDMMLGEVIPGGTGTGLYGMLIFVLITVFIGGLMVGRTPMYLGKQINAQDMQLAAIYILVLPVTVLVLAGIAILHPDSAADISAAGPHGLTEVVYDYTSAAHNNGSAFGGISANNVWYNVSLGITMWIGRFAEIIPAMALAGSLVRKRAYAVTSGTLRTASPLFIAMLIAVVVILVGLTYFPVLALGPFAEHASGGF